MELSHTRKRTVATLTDPKILGPAVVEAFKKLDPRIMVRNPVMFTVEVVATLTTLLFIRDLVTGAGTPALPSRSISGSGSPCCSPTLRKRLPRAAARRRRRR